MNFGKVQLQEESAETVWPALERMVAVWREVGDEESVRRMCIWVVVEDGEW